MGPAIVLRERASLGEAQNLLARATDVVRPVDREIRMQELGERLLVAIGDDAPLVLIGRSQSLFAQFVQLLGHVGSPLIVERGLGQLKGLVECSEYVIQPSKGQYMIKTAADGDEFHAIVASIHASPIATIVTDMRQPDNPIIEVNEPFTRLTGYARDEVVGRNCRLLAGVGTESEARGRMREAVREGLPLVVELTNYKKDGSAFRNAVMIAPVRDRGGNVALFVGSQMEVSSADGGLRQERARSLIAGLTSRQREVLQLMAAGLLNKQIAGVLDISQKTVETYRAQLIEVLGVNSSTHAIRIAIEADLVGDRGV